MITPVVFAFLGGDTTAAVQDWVELNEQAVDYFKRHVGRAPRLTMPEQCAIGEAPAALTAYPPTFDQVIATLDPARTWSAVLLGVQAANGYARPDRLCAIGEQMFRMRWMYPRTALWLLLHEMTHVAGVLHPADPADPYHRRADTINAYDSAADFERGVDVGWLPDELATIRAHPLWEEIKMATIQAPANPANFGGYGRFNTPRALVFHTPEEMPDEYESTPVWFQNPAAGASTHAYADNDGDLFVILDDIQCAWACGTYSDYTDGNGFHASNRHWKNNYKGWAPWNPEHISNNCLTLSIEIEGFADSLDMPEAQYQTVLNWAHEKIVRWGIPLDRDHLIGHGDLATDRRDPGGFFPWDRLMADLDARINGAVVPTPIPGGAGLMVEPLDSAQSLAALELVARNFGAASVDSSVTIVEVTGGLPQDVARYVPQGGHAYIFTTKGA